MNKGAGGSPRRTLVESLSTKHEIRIRVGLDFVTVYPCMKIKLPVHKIVHNLFYI